MIHTKSLIRRLAYVPWLLALGLVVGWTGTAEAVDIKLSLGTSEVREDIGGSIDIEVTASTDEKTDDPIHVVLSYSVDGAAPGDFNERFRMVVPTLIIPKADAGKAKITRTISFTPVNDKMRGDDYKDDGTDDDLTITINGKAGIHNVTETAELKLIDDDKLTRNLMLRFKTEEDKTSLTREHEETEIDVIAYVDGSRLGSKHSFDVVFRNANNLFDDTEITNDMITSSTNILVRDSEYRAETGKINLRRRQKEGSGTINVDPFNVAGLVAIEAVFSEDEDGLLGGIGDETLESGVTGELPTDEPTNGKYHLARFANPATGTSRTNTSTIRNFLMAQGIDLNSDGDIGDIIRLTADGKAVDMGKQKRDSDGDGDIDDADDAIVGTDPNTYCYKNPSIGKLTEANLNLDFDSSGGDFEKPVRNLGTCAYGTEGVISEQALGIDLDGNGFLGDENQTLLKNPFAANFSPAQPETLLTSLREKEMYFGVMVRAGFLKVDDLTKPIVEKVVINPSFMREEEGILTFDVDVTLSRLRPDASRVKFEIEDETERDDCAPSEDGLDCAGIRDVDFLADIESIVINPKTKTGQAKLTVESIDNDEEDEAKVFVLKAFVGDETPAQDTFTIYDDELPTTLVTLKVDPTEVTSGEGEKQVDVTATLNGKVFDEDLKLTLILDHNRESPTRTTAERDIDFDASVTPLTIGKGQVSGTAKVYVTGLRKADGNKDIGLTALETTRDAESGTRLLKKKNEDEADITLDGVKITLKPMPVTEEEEPEELNFSDDLLAQVFTFTAGLPVTQELPAAGGGSGKARYSVSSELPAGLVFDSATRTISGTPTEEAEETEVIYTGLDTDGTSSALLLKITVAPEPPPTVTVSKVELSQMSIREGGAAAEISVKATLEEPATVAETIQFTIEASDAGKSARRDVDFDADLVGNIPIEVGDTQATTTLTLMAIDNSEEDGNRFLAVQARGSGGAESEDIKIADDETTSTSVLLSATPHTVGEDAGATDVTVTASLDGKVLDEDAKVVISIDPTSSATRDEDYVALFVDTKGTEGTEDDTTIEPIITIPANSVSGSIILRLNPAKDDREEGNESLMLAGAIDDLEGGSASITLADYKMMDDDEMMMALMFAEGTMIDDIEATAGAAVSEELPAAEGGSGDITYSVSELPAGLTFDAETRTISGTPEAAGTTEVTYTATDGDGETTEKTFSIVVNPALDFGDLGGLFGALTGGAGKANPASEHEGEGGTQWVIDHPIAAIQVPDDATLQALGGGTPPYTLTVSGLPAGVSYDEATRMISGTPSEVGDSIVLILVTDSNGASAPLPAFSISVVPPPLGAPSNLVAQDYAGADGQGDQGGFLLLTWELSEHHDEIDGYRIFRALPVLANEMVPWAMVDAVPGVERGVAVVATLDNVSTRWGIAAERSGQTTHGAAKAVFVSADQPYAQMAKTLMASMEAAQVGDAPVFASLLPEALAYAQGVAPKLNVVPGVLSSAVVFTDEPVRAIDNIAPLAVPSFSVLDAPDDQGSRIALTWTLSPSDLVLQDVVAGAVGPLGVEPVVGVYGYNIYRRAAGEDEFAMIAQVDAGITSFVDETALNGVRYTYQVRPYDLDNETGSDIEHTAMAVRNIAVDSEGRTIFGLFGADNRIGFDDFFIFADNFGLTAEDTGFDPAFDLSPNATIDFEDFFVFADNFGRSTAAAGKRVPMLAGMNADARMYLDARTALPSVGEDFVLDVRVADFAAIKGYGLQVQYEADKLEFVQVLTDEPLGGSALATPQVLADEAGVLTVVAHGDVVSEGELALSLVFRPTTEIENTLIEIADNQTYDSEFGFNRLALPVPVQLQTRPEAFALANNYPNPFNPATTIKYALPQAADVELTVYNVVGQVVRTLVAEHQSAGRYVVEWDATNDNGHSLSSGMYFYRLQAGGEFHEVKKMLLLK